jgi:hypothetical protein
MRYFIVSIYFVISASCTSKLPLYSAFDSDLPGKTPKVFARGLLQPNGEHVGYCAFSPDSKELYYAITDNDWATSKLIKVSYNDLSRRDTLRLKDPRYEGEPFISWDNKLLYIMAVLPPANGDIWQADQYICSRTAAGWSTPIKLDTIINSKASEWHISATKSGIIYFTSEREKGTSAFYGDIYRVESRDGVLQNRSKLPFPINTEHNDSDPLIAPDESFLIFHSDRPGGFGQHDLFITFNMNGRWTNPVNLGSTINTPGWEMAPTLTPDGKYLLYTHRKQMVTSEPACIFWVSTEILKKLRRLAR